MAVANYEATHGHYPPAFVPGPDGRPWHSWRVLVLPFIEQDPLFKRYRMDEPWDGPNNRPLAAERPKSYAFPGTEKDGSVVGNYLAVVGPETMWPGATPFRGQPKDGGGTILVVENHGLAIPWTEPRDFTFSGMPFELQRPDGISSPYSTPAVATVDGTVRSLDPKGLPPEALRAMLTANGGEKLAETAEGWRVIEDGRDRPPRDDR